MESLIKSRQKSLEKIVNEYRWPRIGTLIDLFLIIMMILYNHYLNNMEPDLFFWIVFVYFLFDLFRCLIGIAESVDKYTYIESKIRLESINKTIKEENR